jgi:hypothetical protein
MAEVKFPPYALVQMEERGLSEAAVREAVESPDQVVRGKRGRKIAQKRMQQANREHLLRVIYEEAANQVTVVTAYKTSKVDKYWRRE